LVNSFKGTIVKAIAQ